MTLWVNSPHHKSPSCQVWWSQTLSKRRNFIIRFSRDLTWLRGQRVMWHYGWVSFIISDYHAKFGDHRPFGRGDIKVSINHLTTWPHGQRARWHHGWDLVIISHRLVKFGGHRLCEIGDTKLLIWHVTLRDHVVRGRVWVSSPHYKLLPYQVLWS